MLIFSSGYQRIKELFPWLTAALVALSTGWASSALMNTMDVWFSGRLGTFSPTRCIYILLFWVFAILLYFQRGTFFRPRTRQLRNEVPEKRKHLILFLSNPNTGGNEFNKVAMPDGLTLSSDLDADIKRMEDLKRKKPPSRWTWEMPLRGIRHHIGKLKSVTIICSKESIAQATGFVQICKGYDSLKDVNLFILAKDPIELITPPSEALYPARGWDFENFDELSDAIWTLLQRLMKKTYGFKEQEIMIDFTGGQKVTSVVAASMTFNRKIKGQYVQTNPNGRFLAMMSY